jgi:hypothetical protein
MTKTPIETQVENILAKIEIGSFDADGLCNLLRNIEADVSVTDLQRENLNEAAVARLRKHHKREAKKMLGAPNSETSDQLETYLAELIGRFDLSANGHKNKVKVGGNVIAGNADIYDYISYRNNDTKTNVKMAFRKIDEKIELDLGVGKYPVGGSDVENPSFFTFHPEQFDEASALFETYLISVINGEAE